MRLALVAVLLAACGASREPVSYRTAPAYHIAAAADVRWPVERTLFIGTVHHVGAHVLLQLDDDPAGPAVRPRRIAFRGIDLPERARAAVSGVGRAIERDEAGAGAFVALAEPRHERDIASPAIAAYAILRREADLSVALPRTHVTAEGIVYEQDLDFVLELPTHEQLRLLVVPEALATMRGEVGKRHRIYGALADDDRPGVPTLAIQMPAFDD